MSLALHAEFLTQRLGPHLGEQFMDLAGQGFFLAQAGEVTCMVDEHARINRHGPTNRWVGTEFTNDR